MLDYHLKVAYYDAKCQSLGWYRRWNNTISKPVAGTYVFLLTAPYVGSTLLHEILSTSPQVTANNIFGTREGVGLPQVRTLIDFQREWDLNYSLDWRAIKKIWDRYWAHQYPLRLDKSPMMILHAEAVAAVFKPSRFVALVRHPYAHCASLRRRNKLPISEAARWCKKMFHAQWRNCQQLAHVKWVRYEDITTEPQLIAQQLIDFIPALVSLRTTGQFRAHNQYKKSLPIQNMNSKNISQLSTSDILEINRIFENMEKELAFFQYELTTH